MSELRQLVLGVKTARTHYLLAVSDLPQDLSKYKPDAESWSILDITEHLVHAEDVGVLGIWKAYSAYSEDDPLWKGDLIHSGSSIEQVVEDTWQPKEIAPEIAEPRIGGALAYWVAALKARQAILEALEKQLKGIPLEDIVYPHPISGPLDARQRIQFLRFHMDRHREQVESIKRDFVAAGKR